MLYYIANWLFATSFRSISYSVVSRLHLNRRRPLSEDPVSVVNVGSIRKQAFGGLPGSLQFFGVVTSFRQCNCEEAIAVHVPSYGAESTGVNTAEEYPDRLRL